MRNLFIATCAIIVLGAAALIGWSDMQASPEAPARKVVATRMTSTTLANGTIVFEEVPVSGALEDIAPAAGDQPLSREPRYKYDPLTQTYRAPRADGGQDIIRDPLNPSKN